MFFHTFDLVSFVVLQQSLHSRHVGITVIRLLNRDIKILRLGLGILISCKNQPLSEHLWFHHKDKGLDVFFKNVLLFAYSIWLIRLDLEAVNDVRDIRLNKWGHEITTSKKHSHAPGTCYYNFRIVLTCTTRPKKRCNESGGKLVDCCLTVYIKILNGPIT